MAQRMPRTPQRGKAHGTDDREGDVREHVPGVRHATPGLLVGERVVVRHRREVRPGRRESDEGQHGEQQAPFARDRETDGHGIPPCRQAASVLMGRQEVAGFQLHCRSTPRRVSRFDTLTMSTTADLVTALKKELKAAGLTYADLAGRLAWRNRASSACWPGATCRCRAWTRSAARSRWTSPSSRGESPTRSR